MSTRRFETVQTRKTINGTAAPGAVLETTDGSLLVLPFEQWLFYRSNHHIDQQNEVLDARFRQRLSLLYKDLEKLVRVPSNEIKNNWRLGDGQDQNNVLLGSYFPEWAYCSISHRFQPIGAWRAAWNLSGPTPPPYSKPRNDDNFNPPRSVVPRRNQAGQNRNQELEQVRFVLAAPNGEIADIPWERWLTAQKKERLTVTTPNGQKMQATILDFDKNIPVDMHMEYKVLERAGDLGGIILTAKNNAGEAIKDEHNKEARESLAGLYNLRVSRTDLVRKGLLFGQNGKGSPETVGDEFILFRPVIRSSNSIYYAQTLDSLFIPTKLAQCATDIITKIKLQYDTLKPLLGAAFTPKLLLNLFGEDGRDITEKYITDLIDSNFQFTDSIANDSEQLYRQAEFNFITKQQAPIIYKNTLTNKPEMAFSRLKSDKSISGIVAIYRLDQLKMVSVLK